MTRKVELRKFFTRMWEKTRDIFLQCELWCGITLRRKMYILCLWYSTKSIYLTRFSQRQNCVHDPWSRSLERIAVAWLNPKLDNILINEWEQSGCTTYDIKIRGRPLRVKCSGCAGWGIWYINLAVSSKVEQNKLPKLHLDIRPSRDLDSHNY